MQHNQIYTYTLFIASSKQHSLGVAHLAEKMCKTIKEEQPFLGATDKDVLCVKLAGLLHDLGHGPYSHLYESFRDNYLPKFLDANPDLKEEYKDCEHLQTIPHWSHEQSSILFIDSLLEELGLQIDLNNLDKPLRQIGDGIDANSMRVFKPVLAQDEVLTSRDFLFIKECIMGGPLEGFDYFVGREDKKLEWLYDIVSNRHNGLDVDKIDYFARDYTRTIDKRGIDRKMITDARVAKGLCSRPEKCATCKGKAEPEMHYMICYPDKHVETVMNFFNLRLKMHQTVYQHKTNTAVESMICDIFCLADPYLRLQSINGEKFPISRAYLKSDFLVRLDDTVLTLILHSTDERLAEARNLCQRLRKHDFYKIAFSKKFEIDRPIDDIDDLEGEQLEGAKTTQKEINIWKKDEAEIHSGIFNLMDDARSKNKSGSAEKLEGNDFIVKKFYMHHGAGSENPLLRVRFYDKASGVKLFGPAEDLPVAKQVDESRYRSVIPTAFRDVGIRVLVRDDSKRGAVNQFSHQWYESGDKMPNQCAPEPTALYNQFRTMDDNEDENDCDTDVENEGLQQKGTTDNPAWLSQDFDDSGEENEDDNNPMFQQDTSPIPVRTRTH